jgi:hypothetical protein
MTEASSLEQYVKRWQCWCTASLGAIGVTSSAYDVIDLGSRYLRP